MLCDAIYKYTLGNQTKLCPEVYSPFHSQNIQNRPYLLAQEYVIKSSTCTVSLVPLAKFYSY